MTKTSTTNTNNTNTNNTNTNNTISTRYIPKLIVNGQVISTKAKQVTCTIKGTQVILNCTYIADFEIKDAYISQFNIKHQDKNIEVTYCKVGARVSATIYINEVLAFSSLSMQGVFTVLNTAYGISKNTLNNLYIKSNGLRKQASKNINSIEVNSIFEF